MSPVFAIVKRLLASNKISFILTALVAVCATSSGDVVFKQRKLYMAPCGPDPLLFCMLRFYKIHAFGGQQKRLLHRLPGRLRIPGPLHLCSQHALIHQFLDPVVPARTVINLMDVCGWDRKRSIGCRIPADVLFCCWQ